ncbi:hypothetical protein M413DRAFT_276090 [Hebeloma cylindrosporum]|uniref:HMG box domain-containing protein n=1 Tax=Hebeloma cylindrosporum TaxID=76867 RepID=A0A0C3BYY5_HEBCY|nr:hypothetical protein M413DRAFT_276090 [Hebeloma cylindrosporum h7]
MPVERTKPLKRSDSAALTGNHFVWTSHVEPTNGTEVSFTPNMSPIAFSDSPPPLVDAPFPPPSEFIMFPPPEETAAPRRQPHSKKKPENHIPRPPNAFILFRSSFIKSQHVSTEVETNHSTLSKIIGITWQSLPEEERQVWHTKAKEALDEHKRKFPKYAFRPVQTKAKGAPSEKRKVREVEPKDMKRCTKIAQLLVQGKKGDELNAAIQEFDKHHVPEIVTRFEAPITARAFRRSSSAPIPDTEKSRANQSFFQQVLSPAQKPRASSTRPSRCSTPVDLVDQQYFSDALQSYPTVDLHGLPLKEEATFNFGSFSFDNISTQVPTYDCDPLSIQQPDSYHYNAGLTIDTSFMNDWAPSPSPVSPSTPYLMSPSPMMCASPPPPSYATGFDNFDQGLEKPFDDFSAQFGFDHVCGGNSMSINSETIYNSFGGPHPHQMMSHLDPDLSAFMTTTVIPQFAT